MTACAFLAAFIVIGLGAVSAWWVDSVLGPVIRGTPGAILFLLSAALLVAGGFGWGVVYSWLCRTFGLRDD